MNRRDASRILALLPLATAWPAFAQAQAPFRVAWVSTERKGVPSANLSAFRSGMRDAGYVEGRNLVLEVWTGDGSGERVTAMVTDILASRPDVIVAAGGLALFPMVRAGVPVPIVFSMSGDPVEARLVASFARPGGNLTGISLFTLALVGKRMELMKEVLPGLRRIAVIGGSQHPGETKERDEAQKAASALGLSMRYYAVTSSADVEAALADIARKRDEAILAFADGFMMGFAKRIADVLAAAPDSGGGRLGAVRRGGQPDDLRPGVRGRVSPPRHARRPHPEGGKAGRPAGRAADQGRARHQRHNREGDGHHDSTRRARAGGRGDPVTTRCADGNEASP